MKSLYGEGEKSREWELDLDVRKKELRMKFLAFEDWINMVTLTDWPIYQIFKMVNFNGIGQSVSISNTNKSYNLNWMLTIYQVPS